jgi:phenylpyruvate tautomerase PptA (4-oxalocrotonate tautomerase family)
MPLLSVLSSALPPAPRRAEVMARLSRLLARELEKPETYVMVALNQPVAMSFGGDAGRPTCYAELKNVGTLSPQRFEQLSALLCRELASALEVAPERIYIEFTNADGAQWGWNGTTFG